MSVRPVVVLLALLGAPHVWAQASTAPSAPPLVPATPPPMPAPEPGAPPLSPTPGAAGTTPSSSYPGTPPPPSAMPPTYLPGTQSSHAGYPYSPYGTPLGRERPGPEVGMMVTESLFGMLTAAGSFLLPYVLLELSGLTGEPTIANVLLIALLAATPMAVAQTQVGIANGSAYYQVENWIPLLTGLLGSALVFATYLYWNGGFEQAPPRLIGTTQATGGVPRDNAQLIYLIVGTTVGVPLLQMAAINLFKQPKLRPYALTYRPKEGLALGVPMPTPIVSQTSSGLSLGVGVSLLRGTF